MGYIFLAFFWVFGAVLKQFAVPGLIAIAVIAGIAALSGGSALTAALWSVGACLVLALIVTISELNHFGR
ncbi:MAG: hypothetical protein K2W82_16605 [Candidatus Obscuribacterales bacterium]|nr:hypothetical protein [Candidatus Obscuribacterales bacterium]